MNFNEQKFRLRVRFTKSGRLAYLSHLEITSALERVVRRANLPFAVSNGFSPHMKLSFGSALPVGVGSTCEIFDGNLKNYVNPEKVLSALNDKTVPDLKFFDAKYVGNKAPAASIAYSLSTYVAEFGEEVPDFEVPETIEVVKKKKTKVLIVDDFLVEMPIIDGNKLEFTLRSSQAGSLRADVLVNAFKLNVRPRSITRIWQGE